MTWLCQSSGTGAITSRLWQQPGSLTEPEVHSIWRWCTLLSFWSWFNCSGSLVACRSSQNNKTSSYFSQPRLSYHSHILYNSNMPYYEIIGTLSSVSFWNCYISLTPVINFQFLDLVWFSFSYRNPVKDPLFLILFFISFLLLSSLSLEIEYSAHQDILFDSTVCPEECLSQ